MHLYNLIHHSPSMFGRDRLLTLPIFADLVAIFAVFATPLPPAIPANPLEIRGAGGDTPMHNRKAAKTAMLTAALNFLPPRPGKGDRLGRGYPPARGEVVRQLHVDTLSATQIQCPVAFLAGTTAFPCTRTRGAGARLRAFRLFGPCRRPPVSASARRPTISGPNCRTTCTP